MGVRRAMFYGIIILSLLMISIWWVFSAGPTTVSRILRYNFSDIDDARIFPRRSLSPAPRPFRFREQMKPEIAAIPVQAGRHTDVPLSSVLRNSETTAFLVIKDDIVRFDQYDHGYDRATPSLSFSMAKSVLSLLVGCAFDDRLLRSIDQPVTELVPELNTKGFSSVTLRHLLQMTSGIDYAENDNPFGLHVRFYYTDHLETEILKCELAEPPGRWFQYKSADAFLLTLALHRALGGRSITEYMQDRVWTPMGMEHAGVWSLDHEPGGLEKTGCCLTATARDFAKFGRLYLQKGQWDGQQIVSADWVSVSTKPDASSGSAWDYQRMWWLVVKDRTDFLAGGHLGQFLYINPSANVVIVRLGKSREGLSRADWAQLFVSLSEQLR
ncbi:MAG: serine hydrolase [Nitrospira sp.]|nr:serine hydrolase [Nitrospira sp.]